MSPLALLKGLPLLWDTGALACPQYPLVCFLLPNTRIPCRLGSYAEDDEGQSKNARVVWTEMKKEENKGLSFWEVMDRLVFNDPGSKLDLSSEWTIEFTVNEPLGDIYFTYLSSESKSFMN